ncbi:dTMP kinase [bacterium]|nr:dTMP kinase [bacterium]
MRKEHKGFFVCIDGIDQCGKSTQVQILQNKLKSIDKEPLVLREPGSTVVSEDIRRILLSTNNGDIDPLCELFLYSASRAQLMAEMIIPALDSGRIVLLDRYHYSTTAYQGYGRGLPSTLIETINQAASHDYEPDLAILIDISPEIAMQRRDETGRDRIERFSLDFFRRVRDGYRKLAENDNKIYMVDGALSKEKIAELIWEKVEQTGDKFLHGGRLI